MTAPTGTSLCDTKVTRLVPIGHVYLAEILYTHICEIELILGGISVCILYTKRIYRISYILHWPSNFLLPLYLS